MKLVAKFAIIFALLSTVSISVMGYLAYRGGKKAIIEDKNTDLLSAAAYAEAAYERWLRESTLTLEILAAGPFFRDELGALETGHDRSDPAHQLQRQEVTDSHLAPLVEAGRFFEVFILRPGDGLVMLSTDKKQEEKILADQPFFIEGMHGSYTQNVYYSMALQRAAMTIATPVKNRRGETVAVIAGHLNLKELSEIMQKGREFTRSRDIYLVNKFNFFVTEPRFGDGYAMKKSVHTVGVNAALSGGSGIGLYDDYRSEPVIGAYRWMPERELAIISEIDQAEAFAPITELKKTVLAICATIAAIAALAGWLTARTITRPLNILTKPRWPGFSCSSWKVWATPWKPIPILWQRWNRSRRSPNGTTW